MTTTEHPYRAPGEIAAKPAYPRVVIVDDAHRLVETTLDVFVIEEISVEKDSLGVETSRWAIASKVTTPGGLWLCQQLVKVTS